MFNLVPGFVTEWPIRPLPVKGLGGSDKQFLFKIPPLKAITL